MYDESVSKSYKLGGNLCNSEKGSVGCKLEKREQIRQPQLKERESRKSVRNEIFKHI